MTQDAEANAPIELPPAASTNPVPPSTPYPQPQRETSWDELNDSQKIERLREVVKVQDQMLADERAARRRLTEAFVEHSHDDEGRPTQRIISHRLEERTPFDMAELRPHRRATWI